MTLVQFGNFADGLIATEIRDPSQNWTSTHVTIDGGGASAPPGGGHFARLIADDTMTFAFDNNANVRIHGIGIAGGNPTWINTGHEAWRALSLRVPSTNNSNTTGLFAFDEMHGDNNTGSAPNNIQGNLGGTWNIIVRGGDQTHVNNHAFIQWVFGSGTPGFERNVQAWNGGNKTVVADEWMHFRMGTFYASDGTGWFEAYARWGTMSSWLNIVPRKTGIYTTYPDQNADGVTNGPFMSLYYPVGGGGHKSIDYAAGAYADSATELATWQDTRLALTTISNTSVPTISGTPQQGNTLTGNLGTWTGSPTLTHQWQWDQGTGAWANVSGATTLSFNCTATFTGAQVRLGETGGSLTAYSQPVTILAPGGGSVFRLAVGRGGGSRIINPAGRLVGHGGGGL